MKAVIMAGGKGTRLREIASDIPKPMVLVHGKPILEYQLESLKQSGINDIIMVIGYLGTQIKDYFKDGNKWNVNIEYIIESEPLGTAGALFYLKNKIDEDFILVFGDLMLDIDWNRFMKFHKDRKGLITLFAHPNSHPFDSDIITTDDTGKVIDIDSKNNNRTYYYSNLVNAGVYCINPKVVRKIQKPEKIDLEKNIIMELIHQSCVFAYKSTEYIKDMGTPERYYAVAKDIQNGIVKNRNLRHKQKCIFLDRDGTINKANGFINSHNQFELIPNTIEAIKKINSTEYLVIIITNQPVIARGECSFEELTEIHKKMETLLGQDGAYIDDLYFCPHHPDSGFEGEVKELKVKCKCRKPEIGLILEAAEKYNINLKESWYIGDTTVDVQTGINANMKTILVKTGEAGKDGKYHNKANYIAEDLLEAVSIAVG